MVSPVHERGKRRPTERSAVHRPVKDMSFKAPFHRANVWVTWDVWVDGKKCTQKFDGVIRKPDRRRRSGGINRPRAKGEETVVYHWGDVRRSVLTYANQGMRWDYRGKHKAFAKVMDHKRVRAVRDFITAGGHLLSDTARRGSSYVSPHVKQCISGLRGMGLTTERDLGAGVVIVRAAFEKIDKRQFDEKQRLYLKLHGVPIPPLSVFEVEAGYMLFDKAWLQQDPGTGESLVPAWYNINSASYENGANVAVTMEKLSKTQVVVTFKTTKVSKNGLIHVRCLIQNELFGQAVAANVEFRFPYDHEDPSKYENDVEGSV